MIAIWWVRNDLAKESEKSRPQTQVVTEAATTIRMIMILPQGAGGEPGRGEIPMIQRNTL